MDISARIRRALYSFGVLRAYLPIKRYKKKTEELTPELIKEYVSSLFRATVKKDVEARKKAELVAYRAPAVKYSLVLIVAIIFAVALVAPLILILMIKPEEISPPPPPPIITPKITATLGESGVLDSKDKIRWYAWLDANITSMDATNITFFVQKEKIPEEVFLLKFSPPPNYEIFYKNLEESLGEKGIIVSEIGLDELLRIPSNSNIVLIVVSKFIPWAFVGEVEGFDMKNFAESGNVLIYAGYPPTEKVIAGDGTLRTISEEKFLERFGISFPDPKKIRGLRYKDALYTVSGAKDVSVWPPDKDEKSVKWSGEGYVFFIPSPIETYLDVADIAAEMASNDISEIIAYGKWGEGYGRADLSFVNSSLSIQKFIFTTPAPKEVGAHGRVIIQARKENVTAGKTFYVKISPKPNGTMSNEEVFVSTALTDEKLKITYMLREKELEERKLFLSAIGEDGTEKKREFMGEKPTQMKIFDYYYFPALLSGGSYILRIIDSTNKTYTQSYLWIPLFEVVPERRPWPVGNFTFKIYYIDETGRKSEYFGEIKYTAVSFDKRPEEKIEVSRGIASYYLLEPQQAGNHTFNFKFGRDGVEIPVIVEYIREKSMFERPEILVLGFLATILFGGGYFIGFLRPEKVDYFIDVPDFPPLHAIAVPIKRETVLEFFDSVNKELKWQYTPLTVSDLKAAFKKILYHGRPITIGDYNLEHILDKLVEDGLVIKAVEYYGPSKWEKETGKSIHYLAMLRALRDLFVVEGIPFIPFGQRKDCDTLVNIAGENVAIHIYSDDSVIQRALSTAREARTITIFEDEVIMKEFTSRIHSPSTTNVMFKLLLEAGKINITPISKLLDVLNKKFTFFYY